MDIGFGNLLEVVFDIPLEVHFFFCFSFPLRNITSIEPVKKITIIVYLHLDDVLTFFGVPRYDSDGANTVPKTSGSTECDGSVDRKSEDSVRVVPASDSRVVTERDELSDGGRYECK